MTSDAEPDGDAEVWQPPLWPRYVGIGLLVSVLVGCAWLVWVGVEAVTSGGGSDVFALVLGGVGAWYVGRELRLAWGRLVDARAERGRPMP